MPDPIVNAASEPQVPVETPVVDSKVETGILPSSEPKQELIDFSPLGDSFKEFKVDKRIADKLPEFLKDISPDDFEHLTDKEKVKLYFIAEKGYQAAHSDKLRQEHDKIVAAGKLQKEWEDKMAKLSEREEELADIEGDAYFYRDPKVKEKTKYANKQVEDGRWTQEEADDYIKPYLDVARKEHKARKDAYEKQLTDLMESNAKIGKETFPEIDPVVAAQLIDGFTVNGSDPQSAAQLFRKELDRVIAYREAKAVADYVKKVNNKQPDVPAIQPDKPIPSAAMPDEKAEAIARGRALFGVFGR